MDKAGMLASAPCSMGQGRRSLRSSAVRTRRVRRGGKMLSRIMA